MYINCCFARVTPERTNERADRARRASGLGDELGPGAGHTEHARDRERATTRYVDD